MPGSVYGIFEKVWEERLSVLGSCSHFLETWPNIIVLCAQGMLLISIICSFLSSPSKATTHIYRI